MLHRSRALSLAAVTTVRTVVAAMSLTQPWAAREWHPLHPFRAQDGSASTLAFAARREPEALAFAFELLAGPSDLAELARPGGDAEGPRRQHDLWQCTCLEVFIAVADDPGYLEVNLAPNGDWNVYAFSDYRTGMREVEGVAPVLVGASYEPTRYRWEGALRPAPGARPRTLAAILTAPVVLLGPAAVLLDRSRQRQHWALTHLATKPDFHRRDGFMVRV